MRSTTVSYSSNKEVFYRPTHGWTPRSGCSRCRPRKSKGPTVSATSASSRSGRENRRRRPGGLDAIACSKTLRFISTTTWTLSGPSESPVCTVSGYTVAPRRRVEENTRSNCSHLIPHRGATLFPRTLRWTKKGTTVVLSMKTK